MKNLKKLGTLAIIVALVLSLGACELFGIILTSVKGNAVNILAPADGKSWEKDANTSLVGAKVTLTGQGEKNKKEFTGIVLSDGTWVATNVSTGRYTLSAVKDGWTFVPMTIDVLGLATDINKNLLAYPTPTGDEADTIFIISSWENTDYDVDSYMALSSCAYYNDFEDYGLSDGNSYRNTLYDKVYHNKKSNDAAGTVEGAVVLDRDVMIVNGKLNGLPVETMRIKYNPFDTPGNGYLRFFSHCYTADKSITGLDIPEDLTSHEAAGLTVYVMQGTEHMGTFNVAENTAERALGIIQIDVLEDDETNYSIMSMGNANGTEGGIFVKSFDVSPVVVELDEIR